MSIASYFVLIFAFLFSFQIQARVPQKYLDAQMLKAAPASPRFSRRQIESGEYVRIKDEERAACRHPQTPFHFFSGSQDRVAEFLETDTYLTDLQSMEERRLTEGQVKVSPWSGDYWPYAKGLVAARFRDPGFRESFDWLGRFEYVKKNPPADLLRDEGEQAFQQLSPAEKYDLLVDDRKWAFMDSNWRQGQEYQDETGHVESWMGICHGWAPAAMMADRPARAIEAESASGEWKIPFNPSEIKGLVSYSWATNSFPTVLLGERCNEKDPKRDENGRLLDPECQDLNPGTWHLAIVNRVGVARESLILDASFDYEVWNQPVAAYEYTYFNPANDAPAGNVEKARLRIGEGAADPFAKYRDPRARSVVGIEMRVKYIVETSANDSETDQPEMDAFRWVVYRYDLELDENDRIIGGEWRGRMHPDFIWTPLRGARPDSVYDAKIKKPWDGVRLPVDWGHAARVSSPHGIILNRIAEGLLMRAAR